MDVSDIIQKQAAVLDKFRKTLKAFFDHLIMWRGDIPQLTTMKMGLDIDIPVEMFLNRCIEIMIPNEKAINERDSLFFQQTPKIFGDMNGNDTGLIQQIWTSPTTDDNAREKLWKWVDAFLTLSKNYVDAGRTV